MKKNSFNLAEAQQQKSKQVEEQWVHQPICCICNKKIQGYHGRWGLVGTCDKACEAIQLAKPRYPGHSEEDFFRRIENASSSSSSHDEPQADSD